MLQALGDRDGDVMKFYKASVIIETEVELNLQAEDDVSARNEASKLALAKSPNSSRILDVTLSLFGQTEFTVGAKVVHKLFGPGTIKDLKSSTMGNGDSTWVATINFDRHDIKKIVLMPGEQLLEPTNA